MAVYLRRPIRKSIGLSALTRPIGHSPIRGRTIVTIFTVDVSSHDGPVDWAAVRAAGISACCIKATEGGGPGLRYTNPLYSSQVSGARAAGIPLVGAYHCLTREDVAAQLRYFLTAIGGGPGPGGGVIDVRPLVAVATRGLAPAFDAG